MSQQLTPDKIMERGLGYWGSRAVLSAIELGIFTEPDCIGWMRDAGFRDPYVKHLAGSDSTVVGIK